MTIHKKRLATVVAIVCLALAGLFAGMVLPSGALAWDDCPKGVTSDCVYPGDCSRYVDTNGDGICDHSQSDPSATTTTAAPTTTETSAATTVDTSSSTIVAAATGVAAVAASASDTTTTTTPSSGGSGDASTAASTATAVTVATVATTTGDSGGTSFLTHYLVSPIAIGFFLIYGVSFVLYKTKRMRIATHRKIWNVLLLATFLITGVFGLILAIQLDYTLPFTIPVDLLFWHVEAGIVMTLISLFHMGWHFNYYRNLLRTSRTKVRAARAAERAQTAADRQFALEARAQRRTEREAVRGPAPTAWGASTPRRPDIVPRSWAEPEAE